MLVADSQILHLCLTAASGGIPNPADLATNAHKITAAVATYSLDAPVKANPAAPTITIRQIAERDQQALTAADCSPSLAGEIGTALSGAGK